MKKTKKSTAFSATVETSPTVEQNSGVNIALLQAIVAACENNESFKAEMIQTLQDL